MESFEAKKRIIDKNDPIIIDGGAFIGNVSTKYLEIFPKAAIYAFEPLKRSFDELCKNSNINSFNEALSDKEGERDFYVHKAPTSTSSFFPRSFDKRYYYSLSQHVDRIKVKTTTLDIFLDRHKIPHVDILKLDLQGSELLALKGAANSLKNEKFSIIYSEIMFVSHYEGGVLFPELSIFLSDFGYTIYGMYNIFEATNGQVRCADVIFVSNKFRSETINNFPEEP